MADYCLLTEAFQDELAPKVEKPVKKKKRAHVALPAETDSFVDGGVSIGDTRINNVISDSARRDNLDPDRQQYVRPKLVEAMKKAKPAWFGTTDNVEGNSYIGGKLVGDSFADYDPNQADFMSGFDMRGTQKASALPIRTPAYDPWGPLLPSGFTSGSLPAPLGESPQSALREPNAEALHRRLRSIYERLDSLEVSKHENSQTEVALFVLTGVFFLFSLDLIAKIGR
jgi:hypothetical protein